ncbi:MAG: fibronectin type III domain-containing protein [Verrucomicrobiaceae bacterium]
MKPIPSLPSHAAAVPDGCRPVPRPRRAGPRRFLLLLALALLPPVLAEAQNVEFRQISSPAGVVNQTTYPVLGSTVSTVTAPTTSSNYTFTHWTLNGTRASDGTGSGANPAIFTITEPVEAVANYTLTSLDSDGDTLPDWYEIHYFGNLTQGPNDDFEGDGFTNAQEIYYGQHPGAYDNRAQGGISRRRGGELFNVVPGVGDPAFIYGGTSRRRAGSQIIIVDPSLVKLEESSSPVGVLAQTRVLTVGSTVNLSTAPDSFNGYRFTGWIVNGARFDVAPMNQPIPITVTQNTSAVARYILETADTDGDGIADWIEWYHFNGLQHHLASDPDGDGIDIATESFRGYSLVAADQLDQGGVSRRRSALQEVDTQGRVTYRLTSDPATILEQSQRVLPGTLLTVPDRTNHTFANYKFAWWDLNGTRQEDPSGAALNQFSFVIAASSTATAHYVDPTVDTDGDGLLDWHERYYYGTLANNGASDTDGDGFTYAQEVFYGQSPQAVDTKEQGGVSRRRGVSIGVNAVLLNMPPVVVTNASTQITTEGAKLNGLVNPFGDATTVQFQWGLTASYGYTTTTQNAGGGLLSLTLESVISGLTPSTTYHFRIVATNSRGTSYGDDVTFTTAAPPYTPQQSWRQQYFGTTSNAGNAADDFDYDKDGLMNLMEWACNLNPTTSSTLNTSVIPAGSVFEYHYPRSTAAVNAGAVFSVEWSDTLTSWSASGVTQQVLSDNGTVQQMKATIPAGTSGHRFVRLSVTAPP